MREIQAEFEWEKKKEIVSLHINRFEQFERRPTFTKDSVEPSAPASPNTTN
jgi:hypothetical protein